LIAQNRLGENQSVFCMMHTADLAIKYALCTIVRRQKKKQINIYQPIIDLRKRVTELGKYVMDSNSKSRFESMKTICNDNCGTTPTRIFLPNKTRVSGFYKLILSLLQNKHAVELFAKMLKTKM
jgi:hypothetical protein